MWSWTHRPGLGSVSSIATPSRLVILVGALLALAYAQAYLGDAALPGNVPGHPEGWWGWADQSRTLRSASAFARGDLAADAHHYPPGYALLGAPFHHGAPNHPFFLVDLACLLAAYAGFVAFCRRAGMPAALAAMLFAAPMLHHSLFRQWVIPWNTTPVAALLWWLLALGAAWLDGVPRPVAVGLGLGAIVACRPLDAVLGATMLPVLFAATPVRRTRDWLRWGSRVAAGMAAVAVPLVALHLATYGFHPSPYMLKSERIGFTAHALGWKAFVIWIDPHAWFADGHGLLAVLPWVALGLAGLVPALLRGGKDRLLAVPLGAYGLVYTSYADLLPTGLWRYHNIHYFLWTMPAFALLAFRLLGDFARVGPPRRVAAASLAVAAVLLCLRADPVPAAPGTPVRAADFAGPMPPYVETFFGALAVADARGTLDNLFEVRVFLQPGGARVVGLDRDLLPPLRWLPGQAPPGMDQDAVADALWTARWRLAWPPPFLAPAPGPSIPVPTE